MYVLGKIKKLSRKVYIYMLRRKKKKREKKSRKGGSEGGRRENEANMNISKLPKW